MIGFPGVLGAGLSGSLERARRLSKRHIKSAKLHTRAILAFAD